MDIREGLLKTIIANPDHDAPRLVMADWLEEHGECDRSEFIRVQCELATMPEERHVVNVESGWGQMMLLGNREEATWRGRPISEERWERLQRCADLQVRERELWVGRPGESFNSLVWFPECRFASLQCGKDVRRGFVEGLSCSWADWSAHAAAILAAQPVTRVRLTTRPPMDYCAGPCAHATIPGVVADEPVSQRSRDDDMRHVLAQKWPGIAFELPPQERPGEELVRRLRERLRDHHRQTGQRMDRLQVTEAEYQQMVLLLHEVQFDAPFSGLRELGGTNMTFHGVPVVVVDGEPAVAGALSR